MNRRHPALHLPSNFRLITEQHNTVPYQHDVIGYVSRDRKKPANKARHKRLHPTRQTPKITTKNRKRCHTNTAISHIRTLGSQNKKESLNPSQLHPYQPHTHGNLARGRRPGNDTKDPTVASLHIAVEIEFLENRAETRTHATRSTKCSWGNIGDLIGVLDMEDRFSGVDHAVEDVTLAVFGALFVDGEVDVVED